MMDSCSRSTRYTKLQTQGSYAALPSALKSRLAPLTAKRDNPASPLDMAEIQNFAGCRTENPG